MRKVFLFLGLSVLLAKVSYGAVCGGVDYKGTSSSYCLKCHQKGCPILHPVKGIRVIEKECTKVPVGFPLERGSLTCVTCHDMNSKNRYLLRSEGKSFKTEMDFCFQCHVRSCYVKFNPHKGMVDGKKYNPKVCIYCHGMGWQREAYKTCVGCHTKSPHAGAYEHLIANTSSLGNLVKKGKVLNISNFSKEGKKRLLWYRGRKAVLIEGKIVCITCHNPHPMTAFKVLPVSNKWLGIEDKDFKYKLRRLYGKLEYYYLNGKGTSLMLKPSTKGLCLTCHPMNSLK